jgi:hypothetical protein
MKMTSHDELDSAYRAQSRGWKIVGTIFALLCFIILFAIAFSLLVAIITLTLFIASKA